MTFWRGAGAPGSGGNPELPARDVEVAGDLSRLPVAIPSEHVPGDLRDPRGDRCAAVRQRVDETHAAGEEVVEGQGELALDGPRDLGLEERRTVDEPPDEV